MKKLAPSNIYKAFTLIELITVIAILAIIVILFGGSSFGCNASNGNGEKIGQVVKLSKEGLFRKTWECQLIRGGMNGGSGSFGTVPFDFTIEDPALVEKAQHFMRDQVEVTITYQIAGVYSIFRSGRGSRGHFLVSIEPAKPMKPEVVK